MVALVFFIIYLLPFLHIFFYLGYDFNQPDKDIGFGIINGNPYMFEKKVIELTAMLGATGVLGCSFALAFFKNKLIKYDVSKTPKKNTLPFGSWLLICLLGFTLSLISSPKDTLFTSVYTQSNSMHDTWNFSSAWMFSYILLTYCFFDAIFEVKKQKSKYKKVISLISIITILFWLQLFRGNRESLPWIFGLYLGFYFWSQGNKRILINVPKTAAFAVAILFISFFVAAIRDVLNETQISTIFFQFFNQYFQSSNKIESIISGTWSAVLLTPLSIAGDYYFNLHEFRHGLDFLNLIFSIPPGFVADWLGYDRPLNNESGPAWEMTYGQGGTHAVVLPFRNFSILGVFIFSALYTFFVVKTEKIALQKKSVPRICFLVTMIMAIPHWLWYGDKNIINAVVIWGLLAIIYLNIIKTKQVIL